MSKYYFAYGSNMNPKRMSARGLHFADYQPAVLCDFRLSFNKRAHNKQGIAYANIQRAQGEKVEGVLYELLSDIHVMDHFEGTPVRYSRELFPLSTSDSMIWAWVYVANPSYVASDLSVEQNYLSHLLSAGDLISKDYRDRLRCLAPVVASELPHDDERGLVFNV